MARDKAVFRCSFCTHDQGPTRRLIGGPVDVFICTDCVALCAQIAAADQRAPEETAPIVIMAEEAAYPDSQPTNQDAALLVEMRAMRASLERLAAAVDSLRADVTVLRGNESGNHH